jgi:hypothetical protein
MLRSFKKQFDQSIEPSNIRFLGGTMKVRSLTTVLVACSALAIIACRANPVATNTSASSATANGRYSEQDMSSELRRFRDQWLAVSTPQEIHALLNDLEKTAANGPADLKFFAQRFIGLKELRGMQWRLEKLADSARVTNSLFLTASMGLKKRVDVFAPLKNWKALNAYLSEPLDMPGEPKFSTAFPQFTSVAQLQSEIVNKLLPKFIERTEIMAKVDIPGNKPFVWDNTVAWGKDSFADNLDRFSIVGENEKTAEIAGRHLAAHNALVFAAWNMNDFAQVATRTGKLFGIDGFLFSEENGVTSQEKAGVIRQFPSFLTLQNPTLLRQALEHLRTAVSLARKSYSAIKGSDANEYSPLDSAKIKPFSRATENGLATAERALQGPTSLRSRVTGEVVEVNVPAMYENPPQDLKTFLPTAFHGGDRFTTNASGYRVRNYLSGNASAWNVGAFKPYFPGINSVQDIETADRILSASWGGGPLAGMLSTVIF